MSEPHVMQEIDVEAGTIWLRCPTDPKGWQRVETEFAPIDPGP